MKSADYMYGMLQIQQNSFYLFDYSAFKQYYRPIENDEN